ncbi:hypothetical protein GCM10028791_27690 [Echinicola sediminis]
MASCGEEEHSPNFQRFTVEGFIGQDPNFSLLSEVLEITGLGDSLQKQTHFTIMAPTNKAFEENGIGSVEDMTVEEWKALLRYHIIRGSLPRDSLLNKIQLTLLADYFLFAVESEGRVILNGDVEVLLEDVSLSNGRVYGIDGVLEPMQLNLLTLLGYRGDSVFLEGLVASGLRQLVQEGEFTLLVPNDQAFEDYFSSQGLTKENWLASSGLETMMQYFILEGQKASEEFESGKVQVVSGDSLFVSTDQEDVIWLNGQAQLSQKDIFGGNGLIHEVDMVYVKPEKSLANIISDVGSNKDYAEFEAAVIFAGLLDELEGNARGPFTVFAPSNQAFADWYDQLGVAGYFEVEETMLRETLQYHIGMGRVFTQDFAGQSLRTRMGGRELILEAGGTTVNGVAISEDYRNQHATNGVLHGISSVLTP